MGGVCVGWHMWGVVLLQRHALALETRRGAKPLRLVTVMRAALLKCSSG